MIYFLSGDEESALPKTNQALKLAEQLGDEEIPWVLHIFLNLTKPLQERGEELLEFIEEAAITDNTNMLAWALQNLGIDKLNLGEFDAAEESLKNGMHAWERIKNRVMHSSNLQSIAYIYRLRGFYKRADDLLVQSIQLGKKTGMQGSQILGMRAKAGLNFDRGDLLQAQTYLDEVKPLVKNDPIENIDYLFTSGRIEHVQGKLNNALEYLRAASDLVKSCQGSYRWPAVYCMLAIVLHELGEDNTALQNFQRALEILSKEYEHPEMLETVEWLAVYCADLEKWGAAARFLAASDSLRQVSGIVPSVPYRELWTQTRKRVKVNLLKGEYQEAWEEASAIEQLFIPEYALEQLSRLETDERFIAQAAD